MSHQSESVTTTRVIGETDASLPSQDMKTLVTDTNKNQLRLGEPTRMEATLGDGRLLPFSPRVINAGFVTGLILAGLCLLLSGGYLIYFHRTANAVVSKILDRSGPNAMPQASEQTDPGKSTASQSQLMGGNTEMSQQEYQITRFAISVHMYIARISLLSTGVFVGLAFGFLGFSLFLIGINGNMDLTVDTGNRLKLQATRMAPGVFVVLASTVLIGVCVTRSLPVNLGETSLPGTSGSRFPVNPSTSPEADSPLDGPDITMPGSTPEPTKSPSPTATPSTGLPRNRSNGGT